MRMHVVHETTYRYTTPANGAVEVLRLTPRSHAGQYIVDWRIDVNVDCRLQPFEDPFGNLGHSFSVHEAFTALTVRVVGEADLEDTQGVVRGTAEKLPLALFLRETPLTRADGGLRELAREIAASEQATLQRLHRLLSRLHQELEFSPGGTRSDTPAAAAYEARRGVCQDYAHIFLTVARQLGVPARYVSGYVFREVSEAPQVDEAGHAWAEAWVDGLGWVAFDPANGLSPRGEHLRVAVALDALGAAPVRGASYGGRDEALEVAVRLKQAGLQAQS